MGSRCMFRPPAADRSSCIPEERRDAHGAILGAQPPENCGLDRVPAADLPPEGAAIHVAAAARARETGQKRAAAAPVQRSHIRALRAGRLKV